MENGIEEKLTAFVSHSKFADCGGIVTDLDGTAVHEYQGRIYIPEPVELGLKRINELGRPLILNSLRFPLSILRTFGREWVDLTNKPVPAVTLNGSLRGYVTDTADDEMAFEEMAASPLTAEEIDEALIGVQGLIDGGIKDLLVFYYPREWRIGEAIWTPVPEKIMQVKEKYVSASSVTAVEFPRLRDELHREDICMIFLLIDAPERQLMAYQHTKRSNFITHEGVDKLFGADAMAKALGINLKDSVGAGDTEMDRFLEGVGLAVQVGSHKLDYRGKFDTIQLKDSTELGDLLFRLGDLTGKAQYGLAA